jgi:hypothetical protein
MPGAAEEESGRNRLRHLVSTGAGRLLCLCGAGFLCRTLSELRESRVQDLDRVTTVISKGTTLYKLVLSALLCYANEWRGPKSRWLGPRSPDDGCPAKLKDTSWSRWPLRSDHRRPAGPAGTAGLFH